MNTDMEKILPLIVYALKLFCYVLAHWGYICRRIRSLEDGSWARYIEMNPLTSYRTYGMIHVPASSQQQGQCPQDRRGHWEILDYIYEDFGVGIIYPSICEFSLSLHRLAVFKGYQQ